MNLAPYEGKTVVVQLKFGYRFVACVPNGKAPAPVVAKQAPDGSQLVMDMPFILGKVVRKEERWLIEFNEFQKGVIEVEVDPDIIMLVQAVGERPMVTMIGDLS